VYFNIIIIFWVSGDAADGGDNCNARRQGAARRQGWLSKMGVKSAALVFLSPYAMPRHFYAIILPILLPVPTIPLLSSHIFLVNSV
jgi:hypothetical protein